MILNDICEVYSGYALKEFNDTGDGLPVIKIGNILTDGTLNLTECQFTSEKINEKYYSQKDDVYVALSGATTGKIGILKSDDRYVVNQRVGIVRKKSNEVPNEFIKYYLLRQADRILQEAAGCAQPNISPKQLGQYVVPDYDIGKMNHIVNVLNRLTNIIKERNDELSALDELIKARFVELFGNPLDGTAKYPIHQVGDVAVSVDPQPSHRTPPVEEGGIPYVSIKDCDSKTGMIDFEGARKVSRKVLEEHLDRYTLHEGDFVIGKIGTIGNPIFVPARNDYTLSANVVLVQPNTELVSAYYLKYAFESAFVERQFSEAKNSTSQAAFGIQKVRTIEVMNPDIEIQRGFESFAKQVDKSKVAVQKALDEAQLLFDSLMQEYFG